ncbi:MAG: ATP-binding cassette domain-containing protein [Candidatus Latescibacteria bacterium]|nr:ATP-binding cassette domain-containing protein [Candidatus Latescibacterota bacterium]
MLTVNPDAPLIQLEDIFKVFDAQGAETHALAGIDLEIRKSEYIAIAGPSGCGKSTLLAILGLLDSPTAGRYLLKGRDVSGLGFNELAETRNRHLGFVFQNFNLIGDLDVFGNVELPLVYMGVPPKRRRERVEAVLERVQMSERSKHYISQLSGGQQQRVAVARALIGEPDIILADEPTGNLDSAQGQSIMDLLGQLHQEGATICLVTHDPRYVGYAQRRIELLDGRVVDEVLQEK